MRFLILYAGFNKLNILIEVTLTIAQYVLLSHHSDYYI